MESADICSSVLGIYDRFKVPPSVRLHMRRVASVAEIICDNWKGAPINRVDIIAACLLHDTGNIVKFDFGLEITARLLGGAGTVIDHWQMVKNEVIAKYGKTDHEANHNMLVELGVSKRLLFLVDEMGSIFEKWGAERDGDNELLICSYADFRVEPERISSVAERFADFAERCKENPSAEMRARGISVIKELPSALEIERHIFASERITPEEINDKSIKPYLERYTR